MCTITETLPGGTLLQEQASGRWYKDFEDQHAKNLNMLSMSTFIHQNLFKNYANYTHVEVNSIAIDSKLPIKNLC